MSKKEKKKKPYKSVLSNVLWCFREEWKVVPVVFMMSLLFVPVRVGLEYAGVYLPSLVVAEITEGHILSQVLWAVGGLMAVILLGNMFVTFFDLWHEAKMNLFREKWTYCVNRKALETFYQTYEKKSMRDLLARAEQAGQQWNGVMPLIDVRRHTFKLIENVLCYLLFGTVLSAVNPWIFPVLTLAPVVNWISVKAYQNWKHGKRALDVDILQKIEYVGKTTAEFSAGKDIRIYGMKEWFSDMHNMLVNNRKGYIRQLTRYEFLSKLADLFVILLRDGWAYAVLISMTLSGEITVDKFVFYFSAIASFASFIGNMITEWGELRNVSLYICDLREYMDYPEEECGTREAEEFLHMPLEIMFDHVCFRYDGAEEDTIKDISFTIKPGEKIALVGLNGAGKTTIVKLLCGLYYPTSGEIRINGTSVKEFRRKEYYRLFAPVFQEVRTAFFSLAETISGQAEENTDVARAEECMRRAGLAKKLEELPEGIHTKLDKQINTTGTELSGGEAQKLMLARALYKDAPVLVLDEPTAALDPVAESEIYQEYESMTKQKSALFISHRLASTRFCDRIFYLESGKISEEGTHEELMSVGGEYKKLYDIQAHWYQKDWKGVEA